MLLKVLEGSFRFLTQKPTGILRVLEGDCEFSTFFEVLEGS